MDNCAICGNSTGNIFHSAREMMFGLDGVFTYMECASCGCLQLRSMPEDMGRYYPSSYYSIADGNSLAFACKCRWLSYSVFGWDPIGWLYSLWFGKHNLCFWMKETGMDLDSSVLDVGCGGGNLLAMMKSIGFKSLYGIDPYLSLDRIRNGILLKKGEIYEVNGAFDIIMLHHSFEHMRNPIDVFRRIKLLLTVDFRFISGNVFK